MKFSFKRFLSSALAAVMTVSVLSVGMVTSVSAAGYDDYTDKWIFDTDPQLGSIPAVYGFDVSTLDASKTLTGETGKDGNFADKIFGGTGKFAGKKGLDINQQSVDSSSKTIKFSPTKDGTIYFYIARYGNSTGCNITFYDEGENNGAPKRGNKIGETVVSPNRDTVDALPIAFKAAAGNSYYLSTGNNNCSLYGLAFEEAKVEIQYNVGTVIKDASSETTTPYVPEGAEVSDFIDGAYIREKLGQAEGDVNIVAELKSANELITFSGEDSSGSNGHRFSLSGDVIKTNGASGTNYRTITVTLTEGQAVMLEGFHTGSTGATGRHAILDGKKYEAPLEAGDVVLMPSSAGEKQITFDNNVNFKKVSIVNAEEGKVPKLTLSAPNTTTDDGYIAYTGQIAKDGNENLKISEINFAYAIGKNGTSVESSGAPAAVEKPITNVYEDTDNYVFKIIIPVSQATSAKLDGLRAQLNMTYGGSNVYYSNIPADYVPAE